MKILLTVSLLLTAWIAQEQKIVTCEVVEPDKSVACPEGGKIVGFSFIDPDYAKKRFDEWRKVAPLQGESVNADAPLGSQAIRPGDKVKAIITETAFEAVSECNVRVWENLNKARRPGEMLSNSLRWQPEDCQPTYGKN